MEGFSSELGKVEKGHDEELRSNYDEAKADSRLRAATLPRLSDRSAVGPENGNPPSAAEGLIRVTPRPDDHSDASGRPLRVPALAVKGGRGRGPGMGPQRARAEPPAVAGRGAVEWPLRGGKWAGASAVGVRESQRCSTHRSPSTVFPRCGFQQRSSWSGREGGVRRQVRNDSARAAGVHCPSGRTSRETRRRPRAPVDKAHDDEGHPEGRWARKAKCARVGTRSSPIAFSC